MRACGHLDVSLIAFISLSSTRLRLGEPAMPDHGSCRQSLCTPLILALSIVGYRDLTGCICLVYMTQFLIIFPSRTASRTAARITAFGFAHLCI